MDQNQNISLVKSNTHIVLGVLVFIVAFMLGTFVGPKMFSTRNSSNSLTANTYDAGWNAAKKRLAESELAPMFSAQDTQSVRGSVEALNGARMSVRIRPLEPLADPALDQRIVTASDVTKVVRLEQKDLRVFQKEMEDFFENIRKSKNSTAGLIAPVPFTKIPAQVKDIKVGDYVVVSAGEDIKTVKEFVATEIHVEGGTK